jgi:hypothetical protein
VAELLPGWLPPAWRLLFERFGWAAVAALGLLVLAADILRL